ncbi:MAG: hypothetical protein BMS9Abin05_0790 [Rhodothermia bacterium]|nr:MAG: hypothetical protein BMS9Abin05_0790 [Rhodothermia bacterium]
MVRGMLILVNLMPMWQGVHKFTNEHTTYENDKDESISWPYLFTQSIFLFENSFTASQARNFTRNED